MQIHKVTVASREYFLASHETAECLKTAVVEAVKVGGGLVDIALARGGAVSVLISPGVAAFFETIETPDEPDDSDDSPPYLHDEHDL